MLLKGNPLWNKWCGWHISLQQGCCCISHLIRCRFLNRTGWAGAVSVFLFFCFFKRHLYEAAVATVYFSQTKTLKICLYSGSSLYRDGTVYIKLVYMLLFELITENFTAQWIEQPKFFCLFTHFPFRTLFCFCAQN